MKIKVKIWIEDDDQNLVFGSGKTKVLEYIDETGSISEASQKIGLNYKKTWNHIKILEKYIEDQMVITNKGRGEQSGTFLTPKAKEIMQSYKELESDIKEFSKQRFNELFSKHSLNLSKEKE